MSLTKTVTQETGFDVAYWRVAHIGISPIKKEIHIDLYGYKDKAAYDADATPAVKNSGSFNKEEFLALTTPGLVDGVKDWLAIVDKIIKEKRSDLSDGVEDANDNT